MSVALFPIEVSCHDEDQRWNDESTLRALDISRKKINASQTLIKKIILCTLQSRKVTSATSSRCLDDGENKTSVSGTGDTAERM